jgi:hypothetical protein
LPDRSYADRFENRAHRAGLQENERREELS